MPAPPPKRPRDDSQRSQVDDFARSVHASYLSRWLSHDPAGLEKAAQEAATERRRRKRTSAA